MPSELESPRAMPNDYDIIRAGHFSPPTGTIFLFNSTLVFTSLYRLSRFMNLSSLLRMTPALITAMRFPLRRGATLPLERLAMTHRPMTTGKAFGPTDMLKRPVLRILAGSNSIHQFDRVLKHDNVVLVPELFDRKDNWGLYHQLLAEVKELKTDNTQNSELISWSNGAHLMSRNPKGSKTFDMVVNRLCDYFHICKTSTSTRINWYRGSSGWKPFHHDAAAYNPQSAKNQNITVGASFGATREPQKSDLKKDRIDLELNNNDAYSFGRDCNIRWKHGVNARSSSDEQDENGRISVMVWGLTKNVLEEAGSPYMLENFAWHQRTPQASRRWRTHYPFV